MADNACPTPGYKNSMIGDQSLTTKTMSSMIVPGLIMLSLPRNRLGSPQCTSLSLADIVAKVFLRGGTQILRPVDTAIE